MLEQSLKETFGENAPRLTIISGPLEFGISDFVKKFLKSKDILPTYIENQPSLAFLYHSLWITESNPVKPAFLLIDEIDWGDKGIRTMLKCASDQVAPMLTFNSVVAKQMLGDMPGSFTFNQHIIVVTSYNLTELTKIKNSNKSIDIMALLNRSKWIDLWPYANKEEDISESYKNVFLSNDGVKVLADLERIVNLTKIDAQNINPSTAVYKCAQEALIQRIKNQIK